jgi:hypothetical protein
MLTPAQLTTLKADVAANTNTIPAGQPWTGSFAGMQVKNVPNSGDGNAAIAGWYNLAAAPDFTVWRDLPMDTVLNAYTPANMTPLDTVPAVTTLPSNPTAAQNATYNNQVAALHIWNARANNCQAKQFNFQNLTIGRNTAPMKRSGYRAGLQDCLTNIPAGAGGALIAANWVGVRDGAKFLATNAEKLFATGTGTAATPADLSFEGPITGADVENARNLP